MFISDVACPYVDRIERRDVGVCPGCSPKMRGFDEGRRQKAVREAWAVNKPDTALLIGHVAEFPGMRTSLCVEITVGRGVVGDAEFLQKDVV